MSIGLGGEGGATRRSCIALHCIGCMFDHMYSIMLVTGVCIFKIYKYCKSDSDRDTIPHSAVPPITLSVAPPITHRPDQTRERKSGDLGRGSLWKAAVIYATVSIILIAFIYKLRQKRLKELK